MYSRPSTSQTRAPRARSMKRGKPPTARNARTGEFTPPGIRRTARANSSALALVAVSGLMRLPFPQGSPEQSRRVSGKVRQYEIGARPSDAEEHLHHHTLLVDPSVRTGGPHHRILPRHVVSSHRHPEPFLDAPDHV